MKRRILIIGILIVIIAGAVVFYRYKNKKNEPKFKTAKVERGDISIVVTATGNLSALNTVQVGTQVSGIIEKIFVDYNSSVKKDQVIAQLDQTFLKAQVAEAEANLYKAKVSLDELKKNYERTLELFKQNLVPEAELIKAETSYESAKATLKQSEANLERAETNLRYATIRSPVDGIVIARNVDMGQTVAASFQTPTLFLIAEDLKKMKVEASIDEADIGKVKERQNAIFTVDAFPEEKFRGVVSQIRLEPIIAQNVVTYTVVIDVENLQMKLRPGMTANVTVVIDERYNVLKVPRSAVVFNPKPEDVLPVKEPERPSTESPQSMPQSMEGRPSEMGQRSERFREFIQNLPPERREEIMRRMRERREGSEGSGRRAVNIAKIYVEKDRGKLEPFMVKTGITDGFFVEIVEGNIKENDEVVIGYSGQESSSTQRQAPGGPPMFRMFR
ncbi:MAG: efflux RND transporter periplasmic adaptor subunit [Acidobacteriota bacterium]